MYLVTIYAAEIMYKGSFDSNVFCKSKEAAQEFIKTCAAQSPDYSGKVITIEYALSSDPGDLWAIIHSLNKVAAQAPLENYK